MPTSDNIQQFFKAERILIWWVCKSMGQVMQTQNCSGRLLWWLESKNGYFDPKKVWVFSGFSVAGFICICRVC